MHYSTAAHGKNATTWGRPTGMLRILLMGGMPMAMPSRRCSARASQRADALIHVQDQREMDVLSGTDFADAEGGFAAAAEMLGNTPALYHLDTSQPGRIKARTLAKKFR